MKKERERSEIRRKASEAFHAHALDTPRMTLRGAYAVDSYDLAPPPAPVLDKLTDTYLETYTFWGLAYLDPDSW